MIYKTILFLDGSKTSLKLLNLVNKNKTFNISLVVISPKMKKYLPKEIKKKKIFFETNFRNFNKFTFFFKNLKFDIGFSYYDFKIPVSILHKLNIGGINFHPSYLPYNRGRHSTFWGIYENTPLGASAHWLTEKFDDGDIFYQEKIKNINYQSAKILYEKQIDLLLKVINKTISMISKNIFIKKKQNKKKATYHNKAQIKKVTTFNYDHTLKKYEFIRIIQGTKFNDNGITVLHDKKKYLINFNYKFKKVKKINTHLDINIKEIFKNIGHKKYVNFNFLYKNFIFKIHSKITKII